MTQPFSDLSTQEQVLRDILFTLPQDSHEFVLRALTLAKNAHDEQTRDEGAPYIIHPIRACIELSHVSKDPEILSAMLLHDVVEDTTTPLNYIEENFTPRTARLVYNLTRPRPEKESDEEKRSSKIEKLQWYLQSADGDTRMIKCADMLDNIRSWAAIPIGHSSRKKFNRWYEEVIAYALPIAEKTDRYFFDAISNAFLQARELIEIDRSSLNE